MCNEKKFLVFGILVFSVFIILISTSLVSAQYIGSSVQYSNPSISSFRYLGGQGIDLYPTFNDALCEAGQDFVIQVDPFGCSPSVVRSDLLEEQNVPVFCPLVATKINPLIDIEAIEHISFRNVDGYPDEVSAVGFHPARAAVKSTRNTLLNSPVSNNIGYAVVVLKRQPNESSMPDFVEGDLTASMRYDIKNAFGVGNAEFYLPVLEDFEWQEDYKRYGFWNGRGYIRVESIEQRDSSTSSARGAGELIDRDRVVVSVYRDVDTLISRITLNSGETSRLVNIPGFYCRSGVRLRLDGLEDPDTRAILLVNSDVVEVAKGQRFLENKCTLRNLEKQGLIKNVEVHCTTDDGGQNFQLSIVPTIRLDVGEGGTNDYEIGQRIGFAEDSGNDLYLFGVEDVSNVKGVEKLAIKVLETPQIYDGGLTAGKIGELSKGRKEQGETIHTVARGSEGSSSLKEIVRKIVGFADAVNKDYGNSVLNDNFDNAQSDYRTVVNDFPFERTEPNFENSVTYSEKALLDAMRLAERLNQKEDMIELAEEFVEKYPNSADISEAERILSGFYRNSNGEISSSGVVINGRFSLISLIDVNEPAPEDYSVEFDVSTSSGKSNRHTLGKNDRLPLSLTSGEDGEFIELKRATTDSAEFTVRIQASAQGSTPRYSNRVVRIKEDDSATVGKYSIRVSDINLKKSAKIRVLPEIDYAGTDANFSFKIGIEKRAINLSTDQIQSKIDDLNETIEKWTDISDGLGDAVKGFKAACLATGTALTVKNLVSNLGGKQIARQKVMRADGGWIDRCKTEISGTSTSLDGCLLTHAEEIDAEVERAHARIKAQNEDLKRLDDQFSSDNFFGDSVVNDEEFMKAYTPQVADALQGLGGALKNPRKPEEAGIDISKNSNVFAAISGKGYSDGKIRKDEARDIEYLVLTINDEGATDGEKTMARQELYSIVSNIDTASKDLATINSVQSELSAGGYGKFNVKSYGDIESQTASYSGEIVKGSQISGADGLDESKDYPIEILTFNSAKYLVVLDGEGDNYFIRQENDGKSQIYAYNGIDDKGNLDVGKLTEDEGRKKSAEISKELTRFRKFDANSYRNKFVDPKVSYYETEPFKGLPAIVPFDKQNGWYAATRQTLPGFGNIGAFDDSGRVRSLWLCNVGENGREQFNNGIGDDICEQINLGTGQPYNQFPGLEPAESVSLIKKAIRAVDDASRQHSSGVRRIQIFGESYPVGSPAANIPEFQCQDFMSPKECNLLFNVCDPVVCPSSRCNLGGAYHTDDVIQSGIIGGIALCLPNVREGIVVPVCLSGIKAGVDGFLSILESGEQCLQEQLDTGRHVGICDEIQSIYMCEFFWRQAAPISNIALPKLLEVFTGQGVRGGGEYLGVKSAWQGAQDSVGYFTQYYAANSFEAFKLRSTDQVGSEVCKNFISAKFSDNSDLLDALIEPDSPPQYNAWFHEIPFTTATVPATSQYKVFYHIYAGKDIGAYYRVNLRSPVGSSFFQENPTLLVGGDYIPAGEFASRTVDFTAASGYQELCVTVNAKEECGFKQVSTSFALDYISDQYVKNEVSNTDITTERECVSGNPNLLSLATPNLQEGANEVVNPALYNRGIVRICATDNPGKGTDSGAGTNASRWKQVGYCSDRDIGCWLDSSSVRRVVNIETIEDDVLAEANANYQKVLREQGDYLTTVELEKEIDRLESKDTDPADKVNIVNRIIDKVFFTNQKAQLYYFRGSAYGEIATAAWEKIKAKELESEVRKELGEIEDEVRIDSSDDVVEEEELDDVFYEYIVEDIILRVGGEPFSGNSLSRSDILEVEIEHSCENIEVFLRRQDSLFGSDQLSKDTAFESFESNEFSYGFAGFDEGDKAYLDVICRDSSGKSQSKQKSRIFTIV